MLKSLVIGAAGALLIAAPAFADCTDISSKIVKLTGCVDDQWQAQGQQGAREFSYLSPDQNFGLQLVTETAVLQPAALRDAIIANAKAVVKDNPDGVKVVAERDETIGGKPFKELEYTITDGSTTLDYQNYYYSAPGFGTVQILALSLPADASAAAFKAGLFASTLKLGE